MTAETVIMNTQYRKTKHYGKNYLIELDNDTYKIYSKDPYRLSCNITLQNDVLTIYKPNGSKVVDGLLYIKCITDFDSFDFWENPGDPGT
jgi:hypothetical protein